MNRSTSFITGSLWLFSSSAAQSLCKVGVTAVLARLLSPKDFGLLAAAMTVITFANMVNAMGAGSYLVQKESVGSIHYDTVFSYSLIVAIGSCIIIYSITPLIASFYGMPELIPILNILIVIFPIQAFYRVSYSRLQRNMFFKKMAGLEIISYLISFGGIGILLSFLDYGVWALVYASVFQSFIYALMLHLVFPIRLKLRMSLNILKDISKDGSGYMFSNLFSYGAKQGDYWIVGNILGPTSLGYYSRAFNLMNAPHSVFGSVLNKVLFTKFSRIQNDSLLISKTLFRSISLLFFVGMPITTFCIVNATEIVLVLLGENWSAVIMPFKVLCLGMIPRLGFSILSSHLLGIGKIKKGTFLYFLHFIVILLSALIGANHGIFGVAIGVTLALIITFLIFFIISWNESELKFYRIARIFLINFLFVVPYAVLQLVISNSYFPNGNVLISLAISVFLLIGLYFFYYKFNLIRMLGSEVDWLLNKLKTTFTKASYKE